MERLWNYLFYCTWKFQIAFGKAFIEKPLISILSLVPLFRKNVKKGWKEYERVMHSKDDGLNIGFAYGFMFLTTMVIFTSICLYIVKLLKMEVGEEIYYYFFAIAAFSYSTNYFCLYQSDKYKRYFNEFDKTIKGNETSNYLTAILFHVGVLIIGTLSVNWTVGFNF